MGIDLSNGYYCNWQGWRHLLSTAIEHGWIPENDLSYYLHNSEQWVSFEDAQNLLKAIKFAIPILEDEDDKYHLSIFVKCCSETSGFAIY